MVGILKRSGSVMRAIAVPRVPGLVEPQHVDGVLLLLYDIERAAEQQQAVPVGEFGVADVDAAGHSGARVDAHQTAAAGHGVDQQQRAAVRCALDAVGREARALLPVAGQRDGGHLVARLAVPVQREPVDLRFERIREPGGARREDHVVDHGAVRADGEGLQQLPRADIGDPDLPAHAAAEEQQPLAPVDFQSDDGVSGAAALADDASTAGGQARSVDVAVGYRPEIGIRTLSDGDALGLEAVRQRESGGPSRARWIRPPGPPLPKGARRAAPPRAATAPSTPRRAKGRCIERPSDKCSTDAFTSAHARRLRSVWPNCGVTSPSSRIARGSQSA